MANLTLEQLATVNSSGFQQWFISESLHVRPYNVLDFLTEDIRIVQECNDTLLQGHTLSPGGEFNMREASKRLSVLLFRYCASR